MIIGSHDEKEGGGYMYSGMLVYHGIGRGLPSDSGPQCETGKTRIQFKKNHNR